jgi:hypothetical protein
MTSANIDSRTNRRFEVAEHVFSREYNEVYVVLDLRNGQYYTLNETATLLWLRLLQGSSVAEIAIDISSHYDITYEEAAIDMIDLCYNLEINGLIEARTP